MIAPKGITITTKNFVTWFAIIMIIIGSIVDSALTRDQVRRNADQLERYNLAVIDNNQKELVKKMDILNTKMDQALILISGYINDE